jgi:polysaccharide deacetylase family protein (PEP-CTERM system associated)
LVREAQKRGHEIASHGDQHLLVYEAGPDRFLEDAATSKKTIEDITGHEIWGYRASGFSVTKETPWFFDKLLEAGYRYDSSVFPAPRGHGGLENGHFAPYRTGADAKLLEFPVAVEEVAGKPICFFGGGYLRFFPYGVIRSMTQRVLAQRRPVIFYVHPREIDPSHPRLPMNWKRHFKSYYNLKSTETKIRRLQQDFELTTFRNYIDTEMC